MVQEYPMIRRIFTFAIMLLAAGLFAGKAEAGDPLQAFYGHYTGQTGGQMNKRNLEVTIAPYKRGFTVEWTTIIFKPSGKIKHANFSINFRTMNDSGLYRSAMKIDTFGHETPLDPLKGEPYVWAVLAGKSLRVNSLMIFENGDYEIQTYDRTLSQGGLDVVFSRVRNGKKIVDISTKLKKITN